MSARHGNINRDPQVHSPDGRIEAANYYGKSSLGKSRLNLYTEVFNNSDSPNNISENLLTNKYFSGRISLMGGAADDFNFNPDFNGGSVNYHYRSSQKINKVGFNRTDEISIEDSGGLNVRRLQGTPESRKNEMLDTLDKTGTYTPNISANKHVGFSGNDLAPEDAYVVLRSRDETVNGGGYGSDVVFSADPENESANNWRNSVKDIHNEEIPLGTSLVGVLTPGREGKLGLFEYDTDRYTTEPLNS